MVLKIPGGYVDSWLVKLWAFPIVDPKMSPEHTSYFQELCLCASSPVRSQSPVTGFGEYCQLSRRPTPGYEQKPKLA